MEMAHKDLLFSRISYGKLRCSIQDQIFILSTPTNEIKYIANELYNNIYNDCLYSGLYFENDVLDILIENELWDENKEIRLEGLKKDIEEIKLKLYEVNLSERDNFIIRTQLSKAKLEVEELEFLRHSYDHCTVEGVALMARQRFLVGCSVTDEQGKYYWLYNEFWNNGNSIIDKIMEYAAYNRISETEYREIARTDPWLRTWSVCKNPHDIFGINAIDLSDEQKTLLAWSILYDNVLEHPNRPSEIVLCDDDRLDGWMIAQKRIREQQDFKSKVSSKLTNSKIAGAQEVYIMPESQDEIKKIEELNDNVGKFIKSRRMNLLKKKGIVNELEMPDTKERLMEAIHLHKGKTNG